MTKPGLYRSDKDGHLLELKTNPVSVTCVICKATAQAKEATEFVAAHGHLDQYLAVDTNEYLQQRLGLTDWKRNEILLSDPEIHWHIVVSTGHNQ